MTKLRCKICGAILTAKPGQPTEIYWGSWESSPYGGYGRSFKHKTTLECPFFQGKTVEELKKDPNVELLEP